MHPGDNMILVIGITGHSGSWFLKRLIQEGYTGRIRCTVREHSDTSLIDSSGLNIEKAVGDVSDDAFLDFIMQGVDTVLHIASIYLSEKIAEAAIRHGVKWLIAVHTTGRYSRYKSASAGYARVEDTILAMRGRIAVTVLRPTMIYGSSRDANMYKLIDYLHRHRLFPVFGRGGNLMQPVHARDLGDSYYGVLTHPDATMNREYNLSGKEPIRYIDILRTVSDALQRGNVFIRIPMALSLVAAKLYCWLRKDSALVNVEQVMRMNEDKVFPYDDAARDFGYSPSRFQDGITDEVRQYLEQARAPQNDTQNDEGL